MGKTDAKKERRRGGGGGGKEGKKKKKKDSMREPRFKHRPQNSTMSDSSAPQKPAYPAIHLPVATPCSHDLPSHLPVATPYSHDLPSSPCSNSSQDLSPCINSIQSHPVSFYHLHTVTTCRPVPTPYSHNQSPFTNSVQSRPTK